MAGGEVLDQLPIRRGEIERSQVRTRHPAHLLPKHRPRHRQQLAPQEMQLDHTIGIRVRDGEDLGADANGRVQLLEDLAREALRMRLSRLALPSGKFPAALEMRSAEAARQEEHAVALD